MCVRAATSTARLGLGGSRGGIGRVMGVAAPPAVGVLAAAEGVPGSASLGPVMVTWGLCLAQSTHVVNARRSHASVHTQGKGTTCAPCHCNLTYLDVGQFW